MVRRAGKIIKLLPGSYKEYKEWHDNVWPEIPKMYDELNIKNLTIFHIDNMLFLYYEYHGDNYERDMRKWADAEVTKKWDRNMVTLMQQWNDGKVGTQWTNMEELFHVD